MVVVASRVPIQYTTLPLHIQTVWRIFYFTSGPCVSEQSDILRRILLIVPSRPPPRSNITINNRLSTSEIIFQRRKEMVWVTETFRAWRVARAVPCNSCLLLTSLLLLVS